MLKLRMLGKAGVALLLMATLSGCTPASDPILEKILAANLEPLNLIQDEVRGYCYPTELFCSNPIFEPAYEADPESSPAAICSKVISLQKQIGLLAYSTLGELATKASDINEIQDKCRRGFETPLKAEDGSTYYDGLVLFDDGARDDVGKVTVIDRRESGEYVVVFSISRNLDRVGYINFAN